MCTCNFHITRRFLLFMVSFFPCAILLAQQPILPPGYPEAQYDESKVPEYTLPDPLVMLNGEKVTNAEEWQKKRRPEIIDLFEKNVYGYTMEGRPKGMTWEIDSVDTAAMNGKAKVKMITLFFTGKKQWPEMKIKVILPAYSKKPVPVFIVPFFDPEKMDQQMLQSLGDLDKFSGNTEMLLENGYGLINFDPTSVEPDTPDGYTNSIRKIYAKPGQDKPGDGEWGAIGAWAWAMSRVMDYIETDTEIESKKVCLTGYSRFGKAAMWAGAQDERFAIVFSGQSGCCGATLVRRQYGETVEKVNKAFPHWFCANFKKYSTRVNDLPVDWHMLDALIAPRPLYIETAQEEYWGDPRGSFLAGKYADPVYELYGKTGLGAEEMPPVESPMGETIGFHMRKGGHMLGYTDYDWEQFLKFADLHFGTEGKSK
ncbi:MAG: acetylxylan esterase [Bacteroidales bacterium]|nr:acetylxylan esterase [Bacteroidales bacterium]